MTPKEVRFENRMGTIPESQSCDADVVPFQVGRGGKLIETPLRYQQALSYISSTRHEASTNIQTLSLRPLQSIKIIRYGTLIDVKSYKSFKQRAKHNPEKVRQRFSMHQPF